MNIRIYVAAICLGLCFGCFASYLWCFFKYHDTRPHYSQPELGRVYASNKHGSFVYLNGQEATGLTLVVLAFLANAFISIIVVPKRLGRATVQPEVEKLSALHYVAFAGSVILAIVVILFAGPGITKNAIEQGWFMTSGA